MDQCRAVTTIQALIRNRVAPYDDRGATVTPTYPMASRLGQSLVFRAVLILIARERHPREQDCGNRNSNLVDATTRGNSVFLCVADAGEFQTLVTRLHFVSNAAFPSHIFIPLSELSLMPKSPFARLF